MKCDKPFLDVGARPHLLRAAKQHPHLTATYLLKKCLFLGIGVGVTDKSDLLAGDAGSDKLVGDLFVCRVSPRRGVNAHAAENHLSTTICLGPRPDSVDLLHKGIYFRAGKIGDRFCEHPSSGGELSSVSGDYERVVYSW